MGMSKSKMRDKLAKADLLSLMKHNSLDEIAKMFNCSVCMVSKELTNVFSKKSIGFSDYDTHLDDEDYLLRNGSPKVDGAWMMSSSRSLIISLNTVSN